MVNIVACEAAYVAIGVVGIVKDDVPCQVASKARDIHFLRGPIRGIEDLGLAAAFRMCFARAVAIFAADPVSAMRWNRLGMRIVGKTRDGLFVATGANIVAYEILRPRIFRLGGGAHYRRAQQQQQTNSQSRQLSEPLTSW